MTAEEKRHKLAKASYDLSYSSQPVTPYLAGQVITDLTYHEVVKRARFFYENDSIAGTVINRMCDIAGTQIRNRHKKYPDEVKYYFDGIARIVSNLVRQIPMAYLIDGIAVIDYKTDRVMGNRIDQRLGRTRYHIPKSIWIRDVQNIILKKNSLGTRDVFLKIPQEDLRLIRSRGEPDRVEEYQNLVRLYPDYVEAVQAGKTIFPLNVKPIMRKLTAYNVYPLPFLKNALPSLEFRRSLKRMDKITSERVITALRHISIGSDEYPADDDDILAAKQVLQQQKNGANNQDPLIDIFTNHTIRIAWVVPPMENLIDSNKYVEANADVFLSMGFPRLWAVGENERSNSADNKIASVGPVSTLTSMQLDIIEWVKDLYAELAEMNGFIHYPDPYFTPINMASVTDLLQYAASFMDKAISRSKVSEMYGSDFDLESEQIAREIDLFPQETLETETTNNDNQNTREFQE